MRRGPAGMIRDSPDVGPRIRGALPGPAAGIDTQLDRSAAQSHQQLEALADRPRLSRADVIDQSASSTERDRDQGPRHVPHVDEIAPGLEIAGDQGQRIGAGRQSWAANSPKAWVGGRPGPTGLNTRATITSSGGPLGQAGDRGQPLAPAVGIDGIARIRLGDRQIGRRHGTELGRGARRASLAPGGSRPAAH